MSGVLALVGPTASGKSALALRLAREHRAEVLSCDSLLVYEGMDIGTAKPTPDERRSVPHHGVDLVGPDQRFTAGDYARSARAVLDSLVRERKPIIIVGGTGFYLKALLLGVWDVPPAQPRIRERLEREHATLPPADRARALHERLARVDPGGAARINANDTYRVIRALEIWESTGKPAGQLLSERGLLNPLPYPVTILGIRRDKPDLERRIETRTDGMFRGGLVDEVRALLERYPGPPRSLQCVGYREVLDLLANRCTEAECRARIVISTRQLAKKQMTFFRGFPAPIEWFDLPAGEQALITRAAEVLSGRPS